MSYMLYGLYIQYAKFVRRDYTNLMFCVEFKLFSSVLVWCCISQSVGARFINLLAHAVLDRLAAALNMSFWCGNMNIICLLYVADYAMW